MFEQKESQTMENEEDPNVVGRVCKEETVERIRKALIVSTAHSGRKHAAS